MSLEQKMSKLSLMKGHKSLILKILRRTVIIPALFIFALFKFDQRALEIIRNLYYLNTIRKIEKEIQDVHIDVQVHTAQNKFNDKVWVFWDTGISNSPDLVKLCYKRLQKVYGERLITLNMTNVSSYIDLPEVFLEKFKVGTISPAHFSDLLRMELLYQKGGIWLDLTVYITSDEPPLEFEETDLFFYGLEKPGSNGNPIYMSSWAMSARDGNELLAIARNYLIKYWEDSNNLRDYFLFHLVICAVMNRRPELKPAYFGLYDNIRPHMLQLRFNEQYDEKFTKRLITECDVHKLTYKYGNITSGSFLHEFLESDGIILVKVDKDK